VTPDKRRFPWHRRLVLPGRQPLQGSLERRSGSLRPQHGTHLCPARSVGPCRSLRRHRRRKQG